MPKLEDLESAWRTVAENRIRSAQHEGAFENLRAHGKPLEDFINLQDPNGWIRRTLEAGHCNGLLRNSQSTGQT